MMLCCHNPQLLNYDWAVELVQQLSGKICNNGGTALIQLFNRNTELINFNSNGFKLLWEKEKNIKKYDLEIILRKKPEIKDRLIAAAPEVAKYFM